jgi:hypothetical protein
MKKRLAANIATVWIWPIYGTGRRQCFGPNKRKRVKPNIDKA